MFRIKICGITNIEDALMATSAGADAIGLNFFKKSRRYIDPDVAAEIVAALPPEVARVGVFVSHSASEIAEIMNRTGIDHVQLHGDEPPDFPSQLPAHIKVIRALRCDKRGLAPFQEHFSSDTTRRSPNAILVDSYSQTDYGGTGQTADWARIASSRELLDDIPLILAGGLNADNVADAIAAVRPTAVDVASGVEQQPGKKDPALTRRFIAAARQAFSPG